MIVLMTILAACGLMISLYFALADKGLIQPDAGWIPQFCRMDRGTCETVLRDADARVLGIPNYFFGLAFYVLVLLVPWVEGVLPVAQFAAGLTIPFGVVLIHSLVRRIRIACVLCYTSHGINLILFLLLITQ